MLNSSSCAMDPSIRASLDQLRSGDIDLENKAFYHLIAATEKPVDWAYEIWDELTDGLKHPSNRVRAVSAQVLCNLAKSDPEMRMVKDLPELLATTRDPRFVTARHCLQSLWKVGAAGEAQRKPLIEGLAARYRECASEKNCTLIRFDIIESLRKIYDHAPDEATKTAALQLIETENDLKYRKKYAGLWKNVK